MGLLRVLCARWLTDDFAYAATPTHAPSEMQLFVGADGNGHVLEGWDKQQAVAPPNIRPVSFWASRVLYYVAYSTIVLVLAVILFIVACIETRKSPCGNYTSRSGFDADVTACSTGQNWMILELPPNGQNNVGIVGEYVVGAYIAASGVLKQPAITYGSIEGIGNYLLFSFTGYCLRVFDTT